MIRVFTTVDHDQHYPVGAASVVVAEDEAAAIVLLDSALAEHGLKPHSEQAYHLIEIDTTKPAAYVLNDGNY